MALARQEDWRDARVWREELQFTAAKHHQGIRAALAMILATTWAFMTGWDQPYWSATTVCVLSVAPLSTVDKSIARMIGTVAGIAFAIFLASFFSQKSLPFCLLLSAWLVIVQYRSTASPYSYAYIIAGVSTIIVAMQARVGRGLEIEQTITHRTGEVLIGVYSVMIVSMICWPQRPETELAGQLRTMLERAGRAMTDSLRHAIARAEGLPPGPDEGRVTLLPEGGGAALQQHLALLNEAYSASWLTSRLPADPVQARHVLLQIHRAASIARTVVRTVDDRPEIDHVCLQMLEPLRGWQTALSETWQSLLDALTMPLAPAPSIRRLRVALRNLEQRHEELRTSGEVRENSPAAMAAFHAVLEDWAELVETLGPLEKSLAALTTEEPQGRRPLPFEPFRLEGPGWLRELRETARDLWAMDQPRAQFAIKVAASVMATFIAGEMLQWSQTLTAMISAWIVSLPTLGALRQKSIRRIVGAVAGGALAFIAVVGVYPHISTIWSYAIILGLGMYACGYVAAASARVNYIGLQAAIAFSSILVHAGYQTVDLEPFRDRILGVIFGVIVSGLVMRLISPVSARDKIDATFRATCRDGAKMVREIFARARGGPLEPSPMPKGVPSTAARLQKMFEGLTAAAQGVPDAAAEGAADAVVETALLSRTDRLQRLGRALETLERLTPHLRAADLQLAAYYHEAMTRTEDLIAATLIFLDAPSYVPATGDWVEPEASDYADAEFRALIDLWSRRMVEARRDGLAGKVAAADARAFYGFISRVLELLEVVRDLRQPNAASARNAAEVAVLQQAEAAEHRLQTAGA